MARIFALPDVGEGLTEAEILRWHVEPGDTITLNQIIVEIETAKAAVELPSPYEGVVRELLVEPGVTVAVGTPLIQIDTGDAAVEPDVASSIGEEGPGGRITTLVGYGPRTTTMTRRPRKPVAASTTGDRGSVPLAKPPVRKLAKDLGVDLTTVRPSGDGGIVTRADVEAAASGEAAAPAESAPSWSAQPGEREQRIPVKGVRKMTARAMVQSAFTAPHVTEFITVDVTEWMALRSRLAALPDFEGVKVTPLLLVAKAVLLAVRRHPLINSTWSDETG